MALVAHLRCEASVLCFARELPCFVDGPCQRLLNIDVFSELHRSESNWRMHVVRRRNYNRIDVFLTIEHLAVILVTLCMRQMLVSQTNCPVDLRSEPLPHDFLEWRFGLALRIEVRFVRWPCQTFARSFNIGTKAIEAFVREAPIDVTHRNDIFRCEIDQIGAALAAHSDSRYVQAVAWGREASPYDVSRHDRQTGARDGYVPNKFAPRFAHSESPRIRKYI